MTDRIAIRAEQLGKCYRMYERPRDRLIEMLRPGAGRPLHREFWAVRGASFELARGEALGILGRNGSGKSTLLQLVAGTLSPTEGSAKVHGRVAALLELGSGFNPDFSGRENVFLNGAILGFTRAQVEERFDAIAAFADIGDFLDQPVKTYSSGMLVRLAFSVQTMLDPEVLIVDEALAVGDWYFQQRCLAHIHRLRDRGTTILFVSHALDMVKAFCERGMVMAGGEVVFEGPASLACDRYLALGEEGRGSAHPGTSVTVGAAQARAAIPFEVVAGGAMLPPDPKFANRLSERTGSGELRIDAMCLVDAEGHPVEAVRTFGTARLAISVAVHTDVPAGATIGVLCRNAVGMDLFSLNSNLHGIRLPAMAAGCRYHFEMSLTWPTVKGLYTLHAGIKPAPEAPVFYDRCFNALVIEVLEPAELAGLPYGGVVWVTPERAVLRTP